MVFNCFNDSKAKKTALRQKWYLRVKMTFKSEYDIAKTQMILLRWNGHY